MLFWGSVGAAAALSGLFVLIVTWRHFGLRGNHSITEPSGLLLILGVGLLLTGMVMLMVQLDHYGDRKTLDNALVEMFGRPPDRLEVRGDRLSSFEGVAYYDGKPYTIEVHPVGIGEVKYVGTIKKTTQEYVITATPLKQ